jgi:hypothetical protein
MMRAEAEKEEGSDWKETMDNFQKITGKINLLYGYLVLNFFSWRFKKILGGCIII